MYKEEMDQAVSSSYGTKEKGERGRAKSQENSKKFANSLQMPFNDDHDGVGQDREINNRSKVTRQGQMGALRGTGGQKILKADSHRFSSSKGAVSHSFALLIFFFSCALSMLPIGGGFLFRGFRGGSLWLRFVFRVFGGLATLSLLGIITGSIFFRLGIVVFRRWCGRR